MDEKIDQFISSELDPLLVYQKPAESDWSIKQKRPLVITHLVKDRITNQARLAYHF